MRQEAEHRGPNTLALDFSYIYRCVLKTFFAVLMSACIAGSLSYIVLDRYKKNSYTASVNLYVVSRDSSTGRVADGSVGAALTRCLNVLNSDTLREQIKKSEGSESLGGTLFAARVGNTNLITMSASSSSAQAAFRLLKAALAAYPGLASYFESGYLVGTLTSLSADNIVVNRARPAYSAAMAALLVFAAGIGLTVFLSLYTDKIHNLEQASSLLDMDMLGNLHYVRKAKKQKALLISDETTDVSYIEEIGKITTRVQEKMEASHLKTLMVSSIHENDGKSTVAANIALNLAGRGRKVLLIDMDLRRPALAKIFDREVDADHEFTEYLKGKVQFRQVLDDTSKESGLFFIWQKNPVGNPDRLLEADILKKTLDVTGRIMDYVILDTPPIGIVRDAEVIAGAADSALMVLRQDEVKAAAVNDVVDILDDTDTVVIGGILNMAKGSEVSGSRKGHYGKYYYGYGKDHHASRRKHETPKKEEW